ncbi:hypothetical protein [Desulfovibrio sp. TomC]|uniref:hypothetical protein n=1 Tax=Desulfovibrio sp. TomC TaxID=1562888 RepID=UPI0012E27370|nr:hypothetical protein [Desulfovibrio sp. TomC]
MGDETFFNHPYAERQLVVFVDDNKFPNKDTFTWKDAWQYTLKMTDSAFVAKILVDAIKELRGRGANILTLPRSRYVDFILPPGHPRNNLVYAGHPAVAKKYIPIADFHRLIFEHKFAEAVDLLMCLGAKKIEVEHIAGWGREFSGKLSVGLQGKSAGGEAGGHGKSQSSILYSAEFEGRETPLLPQNMVWFSYESTWQNIAKGRINFGMKNFSLSLQYNEDYGINASLSSIIQGGGLDAGGKFENHVATTWQINGTF